jgi:hypothetical protein
VNAGVVHGKLMCLSGKIWPTCSPCCYGSRTEGLTGQDIVAWSQPEISIHAHHFSEDIDRPVSGETTTHETIINPRPVVSKTRFLCSVHCPVSGSSIRSNQTNVGGDLHS